MSGLNSQVGRGEVSLMFALFFLQRVALMPDHCRYTRHGQRSPGTGDCTPAAGPPRTGKRQDLDQIHTYSHFSRVQEIERGKRACSGSVLLHWKNNAMQETKGCEQHLGEHLGTTPRRLPGAELEQKFVLAKNHDILPR